MLPVGDSGGHDSSWVAAAASAQSAGLAAVMIGSYFPDDHVQFIQTARACSSTALLYSVYAPSVPVFRAALGDDSEGIVWATTTGTYSDEIGGRFARNYRARFGQAPGRSHAGIAYDRIRILAQTWGFVDDVEDFDDVAERLLDTRYRGVNGAYSFDAGHNTLSLGVTSFDPSLAQAHATYQIQDGQHVLIAPAPYATGTFRRQSL